MKRKNDKYGLGHNAYPKFGLAGQNDGSVLTKNQRKQQMQDKQRHARESTVAFAMRGNPPVIVRPFTHMNLPGNPRIIHSGGPRYGHFKKS